MNSMCFRGNWRAAFAETKRKQEYKNGGATHSYLKENPLSDHKKTLVLEEKEIAAEALDKEVTQREHVL